MSTEISMITTSLLGSDAWDDPDLGPLWREAVRRVRRCTNHDLQTKAIYELIELLRRHGYQMDAKSFRPVCDCLASLMATGETCAIVAYTSRGIKALTDHVRLLPLAISLRVPEVLAEALVWWSDRSSCTTEILGALQSLSCYEAPAVTVAQHANALGTIGRLLTVGELEERILSTAVLANILAFSDRTLLRSKTFVDAVWAPMETLVETMRSRNYFLKNYSCTAVANACAHPRLARRAKELGALSRMESFAKISEKRLGSSSMWDLFTVPVYAIAHPTKSLHSFLGRSKNGVVKPTSWETSELSLAKWATVVLSRIKGTENVKEAEMRAAEERKKKGGLVMARLELYGYKWAGTNPEPHAPRQLEDIPPPRQSWELLQADESWILDEIDEWFKIR